MRSAVFTIFKKELARFFGDKRMAITTILLPGLLIYFVYSFMGEALRSQFSGSDDYVPMISVVRLPESVKILAGEAGISLTEIPSEKIESLKQQLTEKQTDLLLIFPESFDEDVSKYDAAAGTKAPEIQAYYNSSSTQSGQAFAVITQLLDSYEASMINKFDLIGADLVTEKDLAGTVFASMMPMLLMIFLFSGCMAVAPESIAGEKERGTIAALLITPAKRSHIAVGKILALSIIALLSGISSATGTILSLPKLMGNAGDTFNSNVYAVKDYLLLGTVILSTILLLITLISIVSAFAKSVKEAQSYVTPLMIFVMLIGVTAMFGSGPQTGIGFYGIPLYNSVQCMIGIFSFQSEPLQFAVTIICNLLYTGLGVYLLTRMFCNEKIIFSK